MHSFSLGQTPLKPFLTLLRFIQIEFELLITLFGLAKTYSDSEQTSKIQSMLQLEP